LIELKKLTNLNLWDNQIIDISSLRDLINLTNLDLSYNQISDITPLKELKNLTNLDLSYNQISNITPLKELKNLRKLELYGNQIKIFPEELLELNLAIWLKLKYKYKYEYEYKSGIYLENNPIKEPPLEIVSQGNEAIKRYFQDLKLQGRGKLNEAKLIIVGEPEAGKSTLMECLLDDDYKLDENKESTLGINVKPWIFSHPHEINRKLTVNMWDFGGQQIQYMTHQFFLSPDSVYLLVTANDREESTNFDYWFKIINLLGENKGKYSPVIVIKNKKYDTFKFDFDEAYYKTFYPHLQIEVREIDLEDRRDNFKALKELTQDMLSQLPIMNEPRPAKWETIRDELSKINENHINFKRFKKICEQYDVTNEESQMLISSSLHAIGAILHFSKDRILRDFIIINPQWAVDSVYSILSMDKIETTNGLFNIYDLDKVWSKYSFDERNKLLALMKKDNFEICFELKEDNFIAPQFLQNKQPKYTFNDKNSLKFRFQYTFMPKGIISRLIVRLNELIDNKLMWQRGVIVKNDSCRARIVEMESRDGLKIIEISINGDELKRKYLLHTIIKDIKVIHERWFKNIKYNEMIQCNCEICKSSETPTYFKYDTLTQYIKEREKFIKCENGKIKNVDVLKLLEGINTPEESGKIAENLIINGEVTMGNEYHQIHNGIGDNVGGDKTITPNPEIEKPNKKSWFVWLGTAITAIVGGIVTFFDLWEHISKFLGFGG